MTRAVILVSSWVFDAAALELARHGLYVAALLILLLVISVFPVLLHTRGNRD